VSLRGLFAIPLKDIGPDFHLKSDNHLKLPAVIVKPIFLEFFFRVKHNGLSVRGTSRSAEAHLHDIHFRHGTPNLNAE